MHMLSRYAGVLMIAGVVAILLGEALVLHGAGFVTFGFLSHDFVWAWLGLAVSLSGSCSHWRRASCVNAPRRLARLRSA